MSGSASVQWFLPTHGDGHYLAAGAQQAKAGQFVALAVTIARTPEEIRGRVHAAVTSVLKDPAIVIRLRDLGFEPVDGDVPRSIDGRRSILRSRVAKTAAPHTERPHTKRPHTERPHTERVVS